MIRVGSGSFRAEKRREVDALYVFYADVFVMENCLINLAVLLGICHLEKRNGGKYRLRVVSAAVLGAVLTLFVLLLADGSRFLFLAYSYGLVIPFQLVVSFGLVDRKHFFREYVEGVLFVALLFGVSGGLSNLCGIRRLPFLCIFTIAIVLAELGHKLFRFYALKKKLVPVELRNGIKKISALGLYDSGNRLTEPYGGRAVHIVAPQLLKELLNPEENRGMLIPYRALGSCGLLRIYTISELCILESGMEQSISPAVIGAAGVELMKQKDYQIILNQEVEMK